MALDIRTKQYLEKEIPIYEREVKALYRKLDQQFGLHGANVPFVFKYDEEVLGSYTPKSATTREHFFFSLFFITFCNKDSMHQADKIDLYKHEYAHYMIAHMEIPEEYTWQPGKHGSAWKYCCSLIGAAPTPYYKIGEGLKKHDYKKALTNPWADKSYAEKDIYRRKTEAQQKQDSVVKYSVGDLVKHPSYGSGTIEEIVEKAGAVRLRIRFGEELKLIDQKWLLRTQYQSLNQKNMNK